MVEITPRPVTFQSKGIPIAGHLYVPPVEAPDCNGASIVISHPMGGVKEQTAGLHAMKLAERGFVTIAFDAAYQGESGGEPRYLEDPSQRAEDVKCAVTYLTTLTDHPKIDPEKIGVLGICASGGFVPFAAQTDLRMKAVATVSGVCLGRMAREGVKPKGAVTSEFLQENLKMAGKSRTEEAKTGKPLVINLGLNDKSEITEATPDIVAEAVDYYKGPRGQHPRSTLQGLGRSIDLQANFDAYAFNDMISPRPLLMIVGENADTAYFSRSAIEKAKEPKELFVVPGQTHVGLYDHIDVSLPKLVEFFVKALA
ncbi:hypothetical protein ACLMJK_008261 [Lecanora helva]